MIAVNEKGPPEVFVNEVAQGELGYYEVDSIPVHLKACYSKVVRITLKV